MTPGTTRTQKPRLPDNVSSYKRRGRSSASHSPKSEVSPSTITLPGVPCSSRSRNSVASAASVSASRWPTKRSARSSEAISVAWSAKNASSKETHLPASAAATDRPSSGCRSGGVTSIRNPRDALASRSMSRTTSSGLRSIPCDAGSSSDVSAGVAMIDPVRPGTTSCP